MHRAAMTSSSQMSLLDRGTSPGDSSARVLDGGDALLGLVEAPR